MPSFDVVSRVDMQEMDNAVNQVKKEVATRYDFRGSKTEVDLDRKQAVVRILTEDEMKLQALQELLIGKAVRRGVDAKAFGFGKAERASGDMVRQEVTIANGLSEEIARRVVKMVKDSKIRVQVAVQGDEVRVSGKNRDDLQAVIAVLRQADFDIPLQFVNMRE